jgi:AcrR family transcriptional regulator
MAHKSGRRIVAPADARAVRTRHTLSGALFGLLEKKPFERITIREIAACAGIGYATFFRHYDSKETLLHDLAADEIGTLLSLAHPAFQASDTRASALALCSHVERHRALWSALLAGGAASVVRDEFIRQARTIQVPRARIPRWLPADLGVIHGVSATIGILAWWLGQKRPLPVDHVAEIVDRLVIAPTVSTGARRVRQSQRRLRRRK